jgi:hypothetical protein
MSDIAKKVNQLFEISAKKRTNYEFRWYLADKFYENEHFPKRLNYTTGVLERVQFPKGFQPRPIPRAKKIIDSLANLVLFEDPRWVIYPAHLTEEERNDPQKLQKIYENVKSIERFFQDAWHYLRIKDVARQLVYMAAKYNVGYVEVGISEEGALFLDVYEPFDIYHAPDLKDLSEASYLIKVVRKTIKSLKDATDYDGNPLYDPESLTAIKPDYKYSASEYKHLRFVEKFSQFPELKDEDVAQVLIKECWLKETDGWRIITECQGKILRDVTVDYKKLPFVAYKFNEGPIYQTSVFEDLMPLNKALDILVALGEAYTRTMTIGKYLKYKGDKVERMLDEHGEFIEYEGPRPPEPLPIQGLPASYFNLVGLVMSLMEERGAAIISFGKVPKGVKAWRAIESLKSSEITNLNTPIKLFEKTLEEIAERILDIGYRSFLEPYTIWKVEQGQPKPYEVVSEQVAGKYPKAVPISTNYRVKVEIESGVAFTEEGKRQTLIQLAQLGVIPPETLLEGFQFGNVQDIVDKLINWKRQEKGLSVSIIQTPEWQLLPPELREQILKYLGAKLPEAK